MRNLIILAVVAFLPMMHACSAVDSPCVSQFRRLHDKTSDSDVAEIRRSIATVRQEGRGKNSAAIPTVLDFARHHPNWQVRQEALETACAIATPADVPMIVTCVRHQMIAAADADPAGNDERRHDIICRATTDFGFFRKKCVPLLPDRGRGFPSLLALLTDFEIPSDYGWICLGSGLSKIAMRLLPDDEARAEHLVNFIRRAGEDGEHDDTWGTVEYVRPYLNSHVKAELWSIVQESLKSDHGLNRLAAGVLADWGDPRMLPILRRLRDAEGDEAAARQLHLLEAQLPPTRLLSFISKDDATVDCLWAIERAVDHEIPARDIRAAILAYCDRDEDTLEWRTGAVMRKYFAASYGLIRPNDIPAIPYFSYAASTQEQITMAKAISRWIQHGPNHIIPKNCDFTPLVRNEHRWANSSDR